MPECLAIGAKRSEGLLQGHGTTLRFALNQVDIARVTYDRNAPNGVATE